MVDKKEQTLIEKARSFGSVDKDGKVFVKFGSSKEQVGQYADGDIDQDMTLYVMRYVDQINKMQLFERRLGLVSNIKPGEITHALAGFEEFGKQFNAVGDYIALQQYVSQLKELASKRIVTLTADQEALVVTTTAELTKIADKMCAIVGLIDKGLSWNKSGNEVEDLFRQWQETRGNVALAPDVVDPLWDRFINARKTYLNTKRAYFNDLKKNNALSRDKKQVIVEKAEALKETEDWALGRKQYAAFMQEWKAVPRGDKKTDDALWEKFKAANDHFFSRIPEEEKGRGGNPADGSANQGSRGGQQNSRGGNNSGRGNRGASAPKNHSESHLTTSVEGEGLDALAALKAQLEGKKK